MKNVIKTISLITRLLAVLLLICLALSSCSASSEDQRIAAYGDYGADLAKTIARHFPFRSPGSAQEKYAADYLVDVFKSIGFEPTVQTFQYQDAAGETRTSQNVVAKLKGHGFSFEDGREDRDSHIIIGANYDVPVTGPDYVYPDLEADFVLSKSYESYNGIHDNASGVATVITSALQMKRDVPGYNVTFVLFGAGKTNYAGARAYLQSMSTEEKAKTVCMYNVGPIYAGDKVYAHAGQNSTEDGTYKSYKLRRKLYETTDIFFNYQLLTNNDYSLYTNQATFFVSKPGGFRQVIFREWTTKTGSHTPFDEDGMQVVFFDSGEYNVDSLDQLGPENYNPEFRETNGRISATPFDDDQFLFNVFRRIDQAKQTEEFVLSASPGLPVAGPDLPEEADDVEVDEIDHLTKRINNTAFILVKAAQRGPDDSQLRTP